MDKYLTIIIIKNLFINILIYYVIFQISEIKVKNCKIKIILSIISIISVLIYIFSNKYIGNIFSIFIMCLIQILTLQVVLRETQKRMIITATLIANLIVYIGFVLATIIEAIPMYALKISNDFLNLEFIIIIEILLLKAFFSIKRFRKGFSFLKKFKYGEYADIIMINISSIVILAYCLFGTYYGDLTKHILITFIILSAIMIVMIQKTLTLYYKQKLVEQTIKQYELDLKQKDQQIQALSQEKFKISKINHEFYNRQKALELKVEKFSECANFNW